MKIFNTKVNRKRNKTLNRAIEINTINYIEHTIDN